MTTLSDDGDTCRRCGGSVVYMEDGMKKQAWTVVKWDVSDDDFVTSCCRELTFATKEEAEIFIASDKTMYPLMYNYRLQNKP